MFPEPKDYTEAKRCSIKMDVDDLSVFFDSLMLYMKFLSVKELISFFLRINNAFKNSLVRPFGLFRIVTRNQVILCL